MWPSFADAALFAVNWNLELRSAESGAVSWHTDYPVDDFDGPRMVSVTANDASAFVGFTTGPGD